MTHPKRDPQPYYDLYYKINDHTLVSSERLWGLYNAIVSVHENDIPGDLIECGAAMGGSAALMGLTLKMLGSDRKLWVCDTFEGIPAPGPKDPPEAKQYTGSFKGTTEQVAQLFHRLGISEYFLIKGMFQDTLPKLPVESLAVAHFDGDWYESTKCCFKYLYDKVSPGGFIQVDDYGHWSGCRKAYDEFCRSRHIKPELIVLDYTGVQFVKGE
jgi:hypothetical protein